MQYFDDFNAAPPGHSLTQEKGAWDWDSPPRFASPNDAVGYIIEKLEDPDTEENYIKMMFSGISIEEIVESIAMGGFASGYYSPDVAELIKMPIAVYFMGLAEEKNIPARVFAETEDGGPPEEKIANDASLLNVMKQRNPEVYRMYRDEYYKRVDREPRPTTGMLADPQGEM